MPSFGDFIGKAGSSAEQLFVWQVLGQIISALTIPYVNALQQTMLNQDPNTPLSPSEAASMTARKIITSGAGNTEAGKSGINDARFASMVTAAGSAPSIGTVITAYQRQLIGTGGDDPTAAGLHNAYADAGIHESWWPVIDKLTVQWPSTAAVMNALLEGQIDRATAHDWYLKAGGNPDWFQIDFDSNGQAPTPVEALELLNRGIIPESGTGPDSISYEQAFLEGPWRNKWLQPFLALREYLPPPRTVTAMYHDGQLTHDQAAELLTKQGLAADLVAAYLSPSSASGSSTEKHLAKTDIVTLYTDKLMTGPDAIKALEAINYSHTDAAAIIQLADVRAHTQLINSSVTRTRTLFLAQKITEQAAIADLISLGITADQAKTVVDTWAITATGTTRVASESQIVSAWYYGVITTADCNARLLAMGYDDEDAYLVMAARNKGPVQGLPTPPGLTLAPPPPAVTP